MYVCMYVCVCACVYLCIHVCMYVCMYGCIGNELAECSAFMSDPITNESTHKHEESFVGCFHLSLRSNGN